MQADAGSATLLRPETMTASAWLHMYHQIFGVIEEAGQRRYELAGISDVSLQ